MCRCECSQCVCALPQVASALVSRQLPSRLRVQGLRFGQVIRTSRQLRSDQLTSQTAMTLRIGSCSMARHTSARVKPWRHGLKSSSIAADSAARQGLLLWWSGNRNDSTNVKRRCRQESY